MSDKQHFDREMFLKEIGKLRHKIESGRHSATELAELYRAIDVLSYQIPPGVLALSFERRELVDLALRLRDRQATISPDFDALYKRKSDLDRWLFPS